MGAPLRAGGGGEEASGPSRAGGNKMVAARRPRSHGRRCVKPRAGGTGCSLGRREAAQAPPRCPGLPLPQVLHQAGGRPRRLLTPRPLWGHPFVP